MGLTERELLHAEWHARKVVDVGQHMACAVLSNGRVAWWGRTAGSTVPQSADTHIAAVSCGYSHVLALQTDGSVIGWGISQRGEAPSEPHRPAGMRATAISAGCGWSAAVLQDGSVHCWGATDHGQDRTPVLSKSSGRYAVAVSAGFGHALAVLNTGEVVGWGLDTDAFGKVRHSQATPPPMPAGKRVVAAAAGGFFSAVLLHDGTVVCWGCNDDGQCDPKSAAQTRQVVALSASLVSCMALTATGAITSWGRGGPYDHTSVPGSGAWLPDLGIEGFSSIGGSAKEFGRQRAAAVAAGNMFSVAALADGTLIAWGDDADGRAQAPCPDTLGALRVPVKPCPS